jgi:hypothetical protein
VYCVDHWQGSQHDDGTAGVDPETAYQTFLRNTSRYREVGSIKPFRGSSAEASVHFLATGKDFDIVYIDAEHTYEAVKKDIAMWRPMAQHLIAGHDYGVFPGVNKAVCEAFLSHQSDGHVWMAKP